MTTTLEIPASAEPLRIEGEMTVFNATELKARLLAQHDAAHAQPVWVLDLSGVSEIDTAGVQLLLMAQRLARSQQRGLQLLRPSPVVAELLALLNLSDLIHPTTAAGC